MKINFLSVEKIIKLSLVFFLVFNSLHSQIQLGQDLVGDEAYDSYGLVKISADGNRMVVAARNYIRVYQFNTINNVWNQIGNDIVGEKSHSRFIDDISISGNGSRIAIQDSKYFDDTFGASLVKVYEYNGANWIQIGRDFTNDGLNSYPFFSIELSYDGNKLAIARPVIPFNIFPGGDINVYEFDGSDWNQFGQTIYGNAITVEQRALEGNLGWSIALSDDGNQMVFGFRNGSINGVTYPGRVRIYRNIGGNWVQLGDDIVSDVEDLQFGDEISMSSDGNTIAFNLELQTLEGRTNYEVVVYKYSTNNWTQLGTVLQGSIGATLSLSGDGNKIVVSAPANPTVDDINIYSFNTTNNDWEEICLDIANVNDKYFSNVSLSDNGNILALGDYSDNIDNNYYGLVRAYDLSTKITGTALFDLGENGCTSMTNPAENATITITNGTETASVLTDANGNYEAQVISNGNYSISITINGYTESKIYPITDCEESIVNFCIPSNNFDNITIASVSDVSETEGNDLVHSVSMNGASTIIKTFTFLLRELTANYLTDFTEAVFSDGVTYNESLSLLVVPAGVSSFTITIPTVDDFIVEDEEYYNLTVGDLTVAGTIIDNDIVTDPTISSDKNIEGNDLVHLVDVGATFIEEKTYSFSLIDNTTNILDYEPAIFSNDVTYNTMGNLITVPAYTNTFTITIPTIDDDLEEDEEDYTISFIDISATGTIEDNDGFPKFFTPNNDFVNDTWPSDIAKNATYTNAVIYIYDRFGKLLKQLNPNSSGWDGIYNGKTMPSDDYWYLIKKEDGKVFTGHFSLKR